uniref:DUF4283 domain-containing protein n=1 Tax=Cannabis sativa TaxID=3483 RepID=A0A803NLY0_CANSA
MLKRSSQSPRRPLISKYFLCLSSIFFSYLSYCIQPQNPQPPHTHLHRLSIHNPLTSSSNASQTLTSLTDEENLIHEFDHISLNHADDSILFCLVFKVLAPKSVKPTWIEKAMTEAWTLRFPVEISEYLSGMFLATFQCEGDCRRVLEDQSWHFDKFLMIFANPDGLDTLTLDQLRYVPFWVQAHNIPFGHKSLQLAQFIADELGDLIEIHPLSLLESFGPYLRICVFLDVTKPLRRGSHLQQVWEVSAPM